MRIKSGVRLLGLRPEVVLALQVADTILALSGADLVVTSAIDGTHTRASLHYTGCAVDLRRPAIRAAEIVQELKEALGADFDVILETDHVHCEFQPKAGY